MTTEKSVLAYKYYVSQNGICTYESPIASILFFYLKNYDIL
nr:MAG TPA: hypothetical protein [Bacteriophage sp.]